MARFVQSEPLYQAMKSVRRTAPGEMGKSTKLGEGGMKFNARAILNSGATLSSKLFHRVSQLIGSTSALRTGGVCCGLQTFSSSTTLAHMTGLLTYVVSRTIGRGELRQRIAGTPLARTTGD